MSTDSQQPASRPAPAGFWKPRHAVIGLGALAVLVMLMMRACGDDEPQRHSDQADKPRQAIIVQIPASQWPAQQPPPPQPTAPPQTGYGYAPAQRPQPPVSTEGNPWAVQTRPQNYERYRSEQWGQPQPKPPRYVQPSTGAQYRPLEQESTARAPQAPVVQQPIQGYRPIAPYDRLSGSSFGPPSYPYGGAYPGYYAPGMYGAPGGGAYTPGWPGVGPGIGWPGYR